MEILLLEISSNSFCDFLFLYWFKVIVAIQAGARIKGQKVTTILSQMIPIVRSVKMSNAVFSLLDYKEFSFYPQIAILKKFTGMHYF